MPYNLPMQSVQCIVFSTLTSLQSSLDHLPLNTTTNDIPSQATVTPYFPQVPQTLVTTNPLFVSMDLRILGHFT
jgi:hypothetical protein